MLISASQGEGACHSAPSQWVVAALKAAGEPSRLRILALLAQEELAVGELAQALAQSQPRVSRHIKLLADAGLIDRVQDGSWVFCRLARGGGGALVRRLLAAADPADPAFAQDRARLAQVRAARQAAAAEYFARNAADWDRVRRLHLPERDIESAVLDAAGPGPFERMIEAGVGAGRMIEVFAPRVREVEGFDVSRAMLALARARLDLVPGLEARLHLGDIEAPPVEPAAADLVLVHNVLHYLADPRRAVLSCAGLLRPGGRLVLVDFAPHELEFLRAEHAHRRLGFADSEVLGWCAEAGISNGAVATLAGGPNQLIVKIWAGDKAAPPA